VQVTNHKGLLLVDPLFLSVPSEIIATIAVAAVVGLISLGVKMLFAGIKTTWVQTLSNHLLKTLTPRFDSIEQLALERFTQLSMQMQWLQADIHYVKNNGVETKRQLTNNTTAIADLYQRVDKLES
jgi:hypothetical protein